MIVNYSNFVLLIMLITTMCNMMGVTSYLTQETLITVAEIVDQSSRSSRPYSSAHLSVRVVVPSWVRRSF